MRERQAPYGYRWADAVTLIEYEPEQLMLAEIRKQTGAGLSVEALTQWLAANGYRTRQGTRFSHNQVWRMRTQAMSPGKPLACVDRSDEKDCRWYSDCLDIAARRNRRKLPCQDCSRFAAAPRPEPALRGSCALAAAQEDAPGNYGLQVGVDSTERRNRWR